MVRSYHLVDVQDQCSTLMLAVFRNGYARNYVRAEISKYIVSYVTHNLATVLPINAPSIASNYPDDMLNKKQQ